VSRQVVIAINFDQLQQHGGGHGLREQGTLLDAALARPRNKYHYDPDADLADLAAAYAFAIAKTSHPFVDGNKRVGYVVANVFLEKNGYEVTSPNEDVIDVVLAVAAGEMTEEQLAAWFRASMHPLASGEQ
jgi:death-on-curing protein